MPNARDYGSINSDEETPRENNQEAGSDESTRANKRIGWYVAIGAIAVFATVLALVSRHDLMQESVGQPHLVLFTIDDMGKIE
jgi:hypothetical protein